jgi:transcriptional regulator with XRE-family HTH domain
MIGVRLKSLRKNRGMTQKDLADILGVQKSTISQYETNVNSPSDEIKILMARFFNVSLDYLIGVIDTEITFYSEDYFWKISEDTPEEDKKLIRNFIEFADYRRKKTELIIK